MRGFQPDLIPVSAGFEVHRDDPLGGMAVTDHGFDDLARRVVTIADEVAGGRLVCVPEGGYNLAALGKGVVAVLDAMDPRAQQSLTKVAGPAPPVDRLTVGRGEGSGAPETAIGRAAAAAIARTQQAVVAARGQA